MKLTKAKRAWVEQRVAHYSDLLQVKPPKVFCTMAEYNRWKAEIRRYKGQRVGRSARCLGVCHRQNGFIVVLVKNRWHKNTAMLDHTIRHEMIHYTKPSYNHQSAVFHKRMKQLKQGKVKNGRFYS